MADLESHQARYAADLSLQRAANLSEGLLLRRLQAPQHDVPNHRR